MQNSTLDALCKLVDTLPNSQVVVLLEYISHKLANNYRSNFPKTNKKNAKRRRRNRKGYDRSDEPFNVPDGKNYLDCSLDELIESTMTKQEIFDSKVDDWMATHGDCQCPDGKKERFAAEVYQEYPNATGPIKK